MAKGKSPKKDDKKDMKKKKMGKDKKMPFGKKK